MMERVATVFYAVNNAMEVELKSKDHVQNILRGHFTCASANSSSVLCRCCSVQGSSLQGSEGCSLSSVYLGIL